MATLQSGIDTLGDKPQRLTNACAAFLVLTWIAVILRVWVRAHLIRSFGWDDWTILITLSIFTSACGVWFDIALIEKGNGLQDAAKLSPLALVPYIARVMRLVVIFQTLYLWATIVLKISLAIFFLRVITTQWHRNVVYVTTFINTTYGVVFAFIALFRCGPSLNDFLANEVAGKCISDDVLQPMNYISASFNAVTDWIYVFFPIYVVWRAPMPRQAKISAGILLGMGATGSVISLVRIAYIPGLKAGNDFFDHAITVGIWSVVEPGIGILVASLATLRPLVRSMREQSYNLKSFGSSKKTNTVPGSRTSMGRRISTMPAFHGRSAQYQVQDPESGILFEIEGPRSDRRLTEFEELGSDRNKVAVLSEEHEIPATGPMNPTKPLRRGQSQRGESQRSLIPHTFPPILEPPPEIDRAYVRNGKMIVRRSSDGDYDQKY